MTVEINGVKLSIDLADADVMEKYEAEMARVQMAADADYDGITASQGFRMLCGLVDHFFDECFGDGTAKKLFDGKANIEKHLSAFAAASKLPNQLQNIMLGKYNRQRLEQRKKK